MPSKAACPGRYRARIDRDRDKKFVAFRDIHGISLSAPFRHGKPLWSEAYEEALDAINYGSQGGHVAIMDAAYALAEACLDVGEPGWRERA